MSQRPAGEILAELERLGVRLGLGSFRELLAALGHPERAQPVVLVAGTNGKGSTAALLASIARASGARVALHTSPHLERVEERAVVDGRAMAPVAFADALDRVLVASRSAGLPDPTYFEATTAAAFLLFADAPADLAVVEVGMGGRLDATNATDPILSIVTPIALDHTSELGATLAEIAREKAGIFRTDRTALLSLQETEADGALDDAAARIGARLMRRQDVADVRSIDWRGLDGHRVELELATGPLELDLHLAGEHQIENAATAVAAATRLALEGVLPIERDAIRRGVSTARWPGRLESIRVPNLGATVLLDAAHNPHGCRALARFLDRLGRPYTLLFGALADKRVEEMLPPLAARAARVVLTRPASPRAASPAVLRDLLPEPGRAQVEEDPERALRAALVGDSDLVVVCGSIFLVGAIRSLLRAGGGEVDS